MKHVKYSMTDEKVIQMIIEAKESNNPVVADLEAWLHPVGNRGWYTCQITGKKIRGQKAKAILAKQEELMEWVIEQIEQEQIEEAKAEEAEREYIESAEAEQQVEMENLLAEIQIAGHIEKGKITKRLVAHIQTAGRPMKTTTINCVDCGKERIIKVQDAFQVKRCVDCQKKHRNRRRAERRREKRAQERAMRQAQKTNDQ